MTTARVTHATPAALYAKTYDRFWECDNAFNDFNDTVPPPEGTHDIAWQLVNNESSKKAKVMLGGGRAAFLPVSEKPDGEAVRRDHYFYVLTKAAEFISCVSS